jgi:hypothetical protein
MAKMFSAYYSSKFEYLKSFERMLTRDGKQQKLIFSGQASDFRYVVMAPHLKKYGGNKDSQIVTEFSQHCKQTKPH